MTISFREAAKGTEKAIKIPRHVTCPECNGSGAAKGSSRETCKKCGGSGQVAIRQGFMQFVQPCPACHGRGFTIPKPCPKCKGEGIVETVRELSVRIPAGVYDGARLRLRGEGEMGVHGGPPGDLYVVLHVEDDDVFERDEQNLVYTSTITFPQAALGTRIQIPSLNEGGNARSRHPQRHAERQNFPDPRQRSQISGRKAHGRPSGARGGENPHQAHRRTGKAPQGI